MIGTDKRYLSNWQKTPPPTPQKFKLIPNQANTLILNVPCSVNLGGRERERGREIIAQDNVND